MCVFAVVITACVLGGVHILVLDVELGWVLVLFSSLWLTGFQPLQRSSVGLQG